jgi:hypothetical protein
MPDSTPRTRYTQRRINDFVAGRSELNATPLVGTQIQPDSFFQNSPQRPEGPVDLLYLFADGQKPALGFQQVDSEQDESQMYSLTYLDPSITSPWHAQMEP